MWLLLHLLVKRNSPSVMARLFGNKILVLIGKLSYGMYLYHILYNYLGIKAWRKVLVLLPDALLPYQHWLYLVAMLPPLVFICWISWRLVERPLLKQKRYFPYLVKEEVFSQGVRQV